MTPVWREIDTLLAGAILAATLYIVGALAGMPVNLDLAAKTINRFLGFSAPLFAAAACVLLWTTGALIVEMLGLGGENRKWTGVAAVLNYIENAAPFVGLLECFVSIVKALLAYADAGGSASAQAILIANIAVALGASAAGCFVALGAHSLKAVIVHRMED
jgi:hypothetical protein